jgi:hypothetical protein
MKALQVTIKSGGFRMVLRLRIGSDAQHLQGNVVGAAALPGQLHQHVTAFGGSVGGYRRLEFCLSHNAPKAVGTEQEVVTLDQVDALFGAVDGQFPACSESGGEDASRHLRAGQCRFLPTGPHRSDRE